MTVTPPAVSWVVTPGRAPSSRQRQPAPAPCTVTRSDSVASLEPSEISPPGNHGVSFTVKSRASTEPTGIGGKATVRKVREEWSS